jgi:hypothetical protein
MMEAVQVETRDEVSGSIKTGDGKRTRWRSNFTIGAVVHC